MLSKAYLEGRYGAIPVFSTFDLERRSSLAPVRVIRIGIAELQMKKNRLSLIVSTFSYVRVQILKHGISKS